MTQTAAASDKSRASAIEVGPMKDSTPDHVHLKDYQPPLFQIPSTELYFVLGEAKTIVRAKLKIQRSTAAAHGIESSLILDGLPELKLNWLKVNGETLGQDAYALSEQNLTIHTKLNEFILETETEIEPQKNQSFEGLYKTGKVFCTQCEAEGFRKITYFLDRPDVMSVYTVTIEADKKQYPLLLSNGNQTERRELPDGRHAVTWHDPFKKPCYLFALVAGDLGLLEDTYTTLSGRRVKLQIFAQYGLQERCRHAMESLKLAMKWDEDTYGLEYDLDLYMIVVADDFNMGAMENKGLNIFNANYVLANPQTATDTDYDNILAVVGHEYFHNWTGNRVTCRDWFQLSLKEGLTVFRDQRFSGDLSSEAVNRIEQAVHLRTHQFAEDAGPMAHPIRPTSYLTIDNFYTITVYEKGAEVIRMMETLLGRDGFRRGMDLYFARHDGQAVTTEDFVAAMADANQVDLQQFKNWYDQAGTPVVKVLVSYDQTKKIYTLTLEQSCPPTPGQSTKKAFHIPVAVGLIGADGKDLSLNLASSESATPANSTTTAILHLRENRQSFSFTGVHERPALSLLRGFSAPVRVEYEISDDDLEFLMAFDSDAFSRWEAAQTLTVRVVKELVSDFIAGQKLRNPERLLRAFGFLLNDDKCDPAFKSLMMTLPSVQYLGLFFSPINVDAIHAAREHILRSISQNFKGLLLVIYKELALKNSQGLEAAAKSERALKSRALEYIVMSDEPRDLELAYEQVTAARNMTDELGGLQALSRSTSPLKQQALDRFYKTWKNEPLVVNKWLTIQAAAPTADTFERVKSLAVSDVFDRTNPNKIYSLFVAFSRFNLVRFHDASGEPYRYIIEQVLDIDSRNPQVAARLMGAFSQWRSFEKTRQDLMRSELERLLARPKLSTNVYEIATKTLNS